MIKQEKVNWHYCVYFMVIHEFMAKQEKVNWHLFMFLYKNW